MLCMIFAGEAMCIISSRELLKRPGLLDRICSRGMIIYCQRFLHNTWVLEYCALIVFIALPVIMKIHQERG